MDLIKEPNPNFDKTLFLESLNELDKPIGLKIINVGNIFKSKMNNKPSFFVEMEILTDFPDCQITIPDLNGEPQKNEDGTKKSTLINAKGEIIGFPYQLEKSRQQDKYIVSNKTNLFLLLNYAFISKGIVDENNQKGFNNVTFDEITEGLKGLEFEAVSILETKTQFNPYYKLVPLKK